MHISWKWLNELIMLPNLSANSLLDKLVLAGLEVENVVKEDSNNISLDIKTTANRLDALSLIGLVREISTILMVPFRQIGIQSLFRIHYKQIIAAYEKYQYVIFCNVYTLQEPQIPQWLMGKLSSLGIQADGTHSDVLCYINAKWGVDVKLSAYDSNDICVTLKQLLSDCTCQNTQSYILYAVIEKPDNALDADAYHNSIYYSDVLNAYAETLFLIRYMYQASCGFTTCLTTPKKNYDPIIVPKKLILQTLGSQLCNVHDTTLSLSPIVCKIFNSLRFSVKERESTLYIDIPQFRRFDIFRSIDVIEEIGRIYGFDQFIASIPYNLANSSINETHRSINKIRTALKILGLYEVMHYSLTSSAVSKTLVDIYNPLSEEYAVLRKTLIPGLLNTSSYNINQGNDFIESYEIGQVFFQNSAYQLHEITVISGLLGGGLLGRCDWSTKPIELDWLQAKGDLLKVFDQLRLNVDWHPASKTNIEIVSFCYHDYFNVDRSAFLYLNSNFIGIFGQVSLECSKCFNVPLNTYAFELNLRALMCQSFRYSYRVNPYSKYPAITRDLSVKIAEEVSFRDVLKIISSCNLSLIESIQLFDLFALAHDTPARCKNVGLRIKYRSYDNTLTHEEVNEQYLYLLNILNEKLVVKNR